MKCKICGTETGVIFKAKVLKKYDIEYFSCPNCQYLLTEEPYWLEEAYKNPINFSDTGLVSRNIYLSKLLSVLLFFFFNKDGKFLDYAGGYGLFTRLMRDIGFDFYWHDPYTTNLLAAGFEYKTEENTKVELLTAFEVFEHLSDPLKDIEKMLTISSSIVFSTEILRIPIPTKDWWYYGFEHGQHVSFYSNTTLKYIAGIYKLNYYSTGNIHIFTPEKLNSLTLNLISGLFKILYPVVKKMLYSKTGDDFIKIKQRVLKNEH